MTFGVHDFLRQHKDEILRSWETRVISEDRAVEVVGLVLRDDVPQMLDALADWLEGGESPDRSPAAANASKHARQRLDAGMSLAQVLREYRLLREVIIARVLEAEAAEQDRDPSDTAGRIARITGLARLNAGLDVMLSLSMVEFVAERDRRKGEFLAMLAHELRNPLAPIRNSIYLLERAASDSKQATRARDVVRRQTEHLTRIVDDLLDVTRISHGKISLERSKVDLREIVRKTTDDLHSAFAQAGINLRVDTTAGPIWIEADATRLSQVLTNLLTNAVKFTQNGGAVRVGVAAREDRAELCVSDDGVGMDAQLMEHIFEPFAQADHSLARTKGGLGLGLTLVKGIVELHGGTVGARSDGPGRGSEFLIRFPLSDAAGEPEEQRQLDIVGSARTILLIEDSADAAQSLADVLEMHGHRVRIARDGSSGIALAREVRPDVIICDIGLPDVDGYDLVRILRSDVSLRTTRMVALSGYAQPDDRKRARDAGFDAHLAKPVELGELMAALATDSQAPRASATPVVSTFD